MLDYIRFSLPSWACLGATILLSLVFAGAIEIGARFS